MLFVSLSEEKLLSLNDPLIRSAFDHAATRVTREVTVGAERRTISTPFPSPQDWRDVWIYFLLLDRFNRADGAAPVRMPYDAPFGEFQGGTFNGVRERLGYIKDLGAGAIWLSPVLKNRQSDRGTFHGYGIQDFLQPEPRFASAPGKAEDELRALVDEAHALGLYVIFDIVLNHAGDVFGYQDLGASAPGSATIRPVEWRDATGHARPDFPIIEAIPADQRTPDALVWPAELQQNRFFRRKGKGAEEGGDFESLKEFVTDVRDGGIFPVRNALILAYQYAIARYDIDGFRIDTLKYVERDFAQTFGNAMREFALSIGKKNFFTFGEVFDGEERIAEFIGRNTRDDGDMVGVDAALDFPLFFRLPRGREGVQPADRGHRRLPPPQGGRAGDPQQPRRGRALLRDVPRQPRHEGALPRSRHGRPDPFDPQVILGIALLFGLQGIPCLYYGTEQGLHGRGGSDQFVREALWGKPGAFDDGHPFYTAIRRLSEIREAQPALRYGRQYFRPISGDGVHFGASPFAPGVLAFSRILNSQEVVVIANANTQAPFEGHVLVDSFINNDGERFRVLNGFGSLATATGREPIRSRDPRDRRWRHARDRPG